MGFGHKKSTQNPLLVLITCGRLWTAHCEFTLLMVQSRENFLCINLIYKSGNPRSKNCQQLGQKVLGDPSLMELLPGRLSEVDQTAA